MPILLVFTLTAACLPLRWEPPLLGGGYETAVGFTVGAVSLSFLAAFTLQTWVVRTLRRSPIRKIEVAQGYARVRRMFFFVNLGLVAVCVGVFGWGWAVQTALGEFRDRDWHAPPFAELAVPLPYFAILFGAWIIYYDAERALHRTTVLGPVDRPFWSRAGYFFNHLRQFALLVMLPVMLFVTQQSVARTAPEITRQDWYRAASFAVVPTLILLMPLLIKPLLGLKPLPAGPARDRLEALARRLHFRCTDFLLWPTHGAMANAMIVGLLPRVRYVIFTDRLLEEMPPEELDGVLGHEIGHAKHGHIWLYAAFLALSVTVLGAFLLFATQQLDASGVQLSESAENWLLVVPVVVVATYVFLVFGYLSRRCERQADVYGCRSVSCGNPNCTGHDDTTVYPERARGLCPTGIRVFVRALHRVENLNGGMSEDHSRRGFGGMLKGLLRWLRAWQHSTMSRRVAFLLSLLTDIRIERRFQRRVTALRWGLILGLLAALYGLGEAVGWQELLAVM